MSTEKAAYAALEADDGAYEELEDDFLFIANEGKVALESVDPDQDAKEDDEKDTMSGDGKEKKRVVVDL